MISYASPIRSYTHEVEQEAPRELPEKHSASEWPSSDAIDFKDLVLSYRPEIPLVVKCVSMIIGGGEGRRLAL